VTTIEHFTLSWKSGIDPEQFARQMRRLGLDAHVVDEGQADVTVIVADKPIGDEDARSAYWNGSTSL
jgi:hypothetical protein